MLGQVLEDLGGEVLHGPLGCVEDGRGRRGNAACKRHGGQAQSGMGVGSDTLHDLGDRHASDGLELELQPSMCPIHGYGHSKAWRSG